MPEISVEFLDNLFTFSSLIIPVNLVGTYFLFSNVSAMLDVNAFV